MVVVRVVVGDGGDVGDAGGGEIFSLASLRVIDGYCVCAGVNPPWECDVMFSAGSSRQIDPGARAEGDRKPRPRTTTLCPRTSSALLVLGLGDRIPWLAPDTGSEACVAREEAVLSHGAGGARALACSLRITFHLRQPLAVTGSEPVDPIMVGGVHGERCLRNIEGFG